MLVVVGLEAQQQFLIENGGDPLECRETRRVRATLQPRDRAVRGSSGVCDLTLGQAKLEAPLAQVRRDRVGLAQLTDPRVLVAGGSIVRRARREFLGVLGDGLADRADPSGRTSQQPGYQHW